MAHSVELRTPLVDSKFLSDVSPIVPSAGSMVGKRALGLAPSTSLPATIVERKKTGFGVPMNSWMRGETLVRRQLQTERGLVAREWAKDVFARFNAPDESKQPPSNFGNLDHEIESVGAGN
jgi:asparagine synthase (glutamine-hydrolysing)